MDAAKPRDQGDDRPRPSLIVQRSLKRLKGTGLVLSETKTNASRRLVRLPMPTVDALRRRKLQREERLLVGADWPTLPSTAISSSAPDGHALDPDNFRQITYVVSEAAASVDGRPTRCAIRRQPADRPGCAAQDDQRGARAQLDPHHPRRLRTPPRQSRDGRRRRHDLRPLGNLIQEARNRMPSTHVSAK